MTAFWCEWAMVDGFPAAAVRIEHSGGVITSVRSGALPERTDSRLDGLTFPGFANGHSHAFHRALRGRTHGDGGTFWNWRERMYGASAKLKPDTYYELATAAFAEMVLAGYTAVGEFHYVHYREYGGAYDPTTAMEDAVVAAADRAGIRLTLLDALYLSSGLVASGAGRALEHRQRRFSDETIEAWTARRLRISTGRLATVGAAIHSVRAVPPSLYPLVRDATDGVPLHAHVSEQRAENADSLAATGLTPTGLFANASLLGPHFTAVHGTHLSPGDIGLLGESGSTVCFCPTTERDLADGIGPARALHDAGVSLSLGSDQNAVVDPFEELRGLEMNERLSSGERGRFSPLQLLDAATAAGYGSLGWNGGSIRQGAVCDLVSVENRSPRTAGALNGQLWMAATSADVTTVVVGGEVRVTSGTHQLGDVGQLLANSIEGISL